MSLTKHERKECTKLLRSCKVEAYALTKLAYKEATLFQETKRSHVRSSSAPINSFYMDLYDELTSFIVDLYVRLSLDSPLPWMSALSYLLTHQTSLYSLPDIDVYYEQLNKLHDKVEQALSRPEDKYLSGYCSKCGKELYAPAHALIVMCTNCKTSNLLTESRKSLYEKHRQQIERQTISCSPIEAARKVNAICSTRITDTDIKNWIRRSKVRCQKIGKGRYLFNLTSLCQQAIDKIQ